jgi:hypothetical protein
LTLTVRARNTNVENEKANEANVELGEPAKETTLEMSETTTASETKYLTGLPLYLLCFALMAAIFMVAIDLSIICK